MEAAPHASPPGKLRPLDYEFPEQVAIVQRIALQWCPHFSPSEFKVLVWLVGNTILRGKRSGVYSVAQIVNGVPNRRDGGMWAKGTGLSERTVVSAMQALEAKGVIDAAVTERGKTVTVIPSWNPKAGQAEENNVVALNLPRAARRAQSRPGVISGQQPDTFAEEVGCAESAPAPLQTLHSLPRKLCTPSNPKPTNTILSNEDPAEAVEPAGSQPGTSASRPAPSLPPVRVRRRLAPINAGSTVPDANEDRSDPGNVVPSPRCAAPPPADRFDPGQSVTAAIEAAKGRTPVRLQAIRQRKDAHAYEATWSAAWGQAYPGRPCVAWTKKSGGMIKKAVARWPEAALGSVHAFLEWTVGNWDVVLATKLTRLKGERPSQPDIEFVARFISAFQEAWADKEELRWRGTQPGTQQSVIALMRREAISKDVALAKVMATQASQRDRAAIEKIAARARQDRDMAILAADRASRATRFTAANPHPRAHENTPKKASMVPGEPTWTLPKLVFDESKL